LPVSFFLTLKTLPKLPSPNYSNIWKSEKKTLLLSLPSPCSIFYYPESLSPKFGALLSNAISVVSASEALSCEVSTRHPPRCMSLIREAAGICLGVFINEIFLSSGGLTEDAGINRDALNSSIAFSTYIPARAYINYSSCLRRFFSLVASWSPI